MILYWLLNKVLHYHEKNASEKKKRKKKENKQKENTTETLLQLSINSSESDFRSYEATKAVAKKAQKKF